MRNAIDKNLKAFTAVLLLSCSASAAPRVDDILQDVTAHFQSKTLTVQKQQETADVLLPLFLEAMKHKDRALLEKINQVCALVLQSIRQEFSQVTDEEFIQADGSVGVALEKSIKSKADKDEQVDVLVREAKYLLPSAYYTLQQYYRMPEYQDQQTRILNFFQSSAQAGMPDSQLFVGKVFLNGWGVTPDVTRGISFLEASKMNQAYRLLADYHYYVGKVADYEKYLRIMANEQQDAKAQHDLGVIEQKKQNASTALNLFNQVLQSRNIGPNAEVVLDTKFKLAHMLIEGLGIPRDKARGFELIQSIVDSKDIYDQEAKALALMELALCYQKGLGAQVDAVKAAQYFEEAARLTEFNIKFNAAIRRARGLDQQPDQVQAFQIMKELTENKNVNQQAQSLALTNLGLFYQNGVGTKVSFSQARKCFEAALALGDEEAQYYLDDLSRLERQA